MGLLEDQKKIVRTLWNGFGNNPRNQETVDAIKGMFGLLPLGAGDVASGLLAADDVRRGDYLSAGLNGVGLLPFVPSMAGMVKAKEPFTFLRNTIPAPRPLSSATDQFAQKIEPAGRYMIEDTSNIAKDNKLPDGWISGEHTFDNPKFIEWGNGGYNDADNWKQVLNKEYKGKKGKSLSKALVKDGYDGIVTIGKDGETKEIIDLSMFKGLLGQ